MVFLPFSNISVDEFSQCKKNPNNKYVHFLTHMHSDHHSGMINGWNYGKLYCSQISANLLKEKFHNVKQVIPLALNQKFTIEVGDNLSINVTLLDANHCPGAVMFLFEGYFGTYLYTGDIRFDKEVFKKYTDIYPQYMANSDFIKCSKKIDVLYLDNTFCDSVFTFPSRTQVLKQIQEFVRKCLEEKKKIYIAIDNLGKEEILTYLAYTFATYIVVPQKKYYSLLNCQIDNQMFTTRSEEGYIEVIGKRQMKNKLSLNPNSVGIIPTGWCNKSFHSMQGRLHMFPYSLHSNFPELQAFMRSLDVGRVQPIVRNFESSQKLSDDYGEVIQTQSIYRLSQLSQRGLPYLQSKYTNGQYTQFQSQLIKDIEYYRLISQSFTTYQKQIPQQYINTDSFKRADNVQSLIKTRQKSIFNQNIKRAQMKKQKDKEVQKEGDKAKQTNYEEMKINLMKRVNEQREQLKNKGVQMKSKTFYENKYNLSKQIKISSQRSRSGSRQEQEQIHEIKRKTVFISQASKQRARQKTIKYQKNKFKKIETVEIDQQQERQDEIQTKKQFPLKRNAIYQKQQKTKQVTLPFQTTTSYLNNSTLQRYFKQAMLKQKHNRDVLHNNNQTIEVKQKVIALQDQLNIQYEQQQKQMIRLYHHRSQGNYSYQKWND